MHRCIVCFARPAADVDAAFCDDVCAEAWIANARASMESIRRRIEVEAAVERAVGPAMAGHVLAAFNDAEATGLLN